jgi:hypothetical protein
MTSRAARFRLGRLRGNAGRRNIESENGDCRLGSMWKACAVAKMTALSFSMNQGLD